MIPLLAALLLGAARAEAQGARPNVLFIAVDDLNDWVGVLGGHPQTRTPNIDRLASRGVLFTSAFTNAPLCTPSRESLFTGRQPFSLDFYTLTRPPGRAWPHDQHLTLPQHFRANGYRALGAGKLFHPGGNVVPSAFDEYGPGIGASGGPFTSEEISTLKQNPTHAIDRGPGKLKAVLPMNGMPDERRAVGRTGSNTFDWGPVDVTDDEMPDGQVAAWAVEALGRRHDRPFFLGVGFFRPHQPLFVPRKYFAPFPADRVVLPATQPHDLRDVPVAGRFTALEPNTAGSHRMVVEHDQWRAAVAGYLASVHFVDAQIGRVLDALDASPYRDDTIIVLWSDHGYHTGEKEHWGKWTGWSPSTRVPVIVVPPARRAPGGFRAGSTSAAPVSLIDLYPTLVSLAGLPAPDGLEGRDLSPLLANPAAAGWDAPAISTFGRGNHMLRDRRWHYIHYFDGTEELYDIARDPHQWANLAADPRQAEVLRAMRQRLPAYPQVRHFARMGVWKAVLYADGRPPELFRLGPMEIDETDNLAAQNPEVMRAIEERIARRPGAPKFLVVE